MILRLNNVTIPITKRQDESILEALQEYKIIPEAIDHINYLTRSIDSRSKQMVYFIYSLEVHLKYPISITHDKIEIIEKETRKNWIKNPYKANNVAIIGSGPAGLFAAYKLVQLGFKPHIFERGEPIEIRKKSVNFFWTKNVFNPESNVQFGEGGAGTFSDGKLTHRMKGNPYLNEVFQLFVECGAQKEILFDYMPHIGTDRLQVVVRNIRRKLEEHGAVFHFNSKLTDIVTMGSQIERIIINNNESFDVSAVILATGHSATDVYHLLNNKKVGMESKDFAVGLRIEHPRTLIDKMQYGRFAGHPALGAATYKFTYNNTHDKRGVYSFCMCPGGEIVNAASERGHTLVNGMSLSHRNSNFSNSAIVVAVKKSDYGRNLFDGVHFQRKLEKQINSLTQAEGTLFQNLSDFQKNCVTINEIESSFRMKLTPYNLNKLLPNFITENLHLAFESWKRHKYFISDTANLFAAETRTSAPIRILRNEDGSSVSIKNLFPIGEGAGYAGGIVSSAVDGLKVVEQNFAKEV
ncbi:MAG: NAD(P)-binding protein [Fusobacteria bacterium]|nr:NAD(P)-binding protein [Fusobacteriota bacterium]